MWVVFLLCESRVFSSSTHHQAGPGFYPCRSQSRRPAAKQRNKDGTADIWNTQNKGRERGCKGCSVFKYTQRCCSNLSSSGPGKVLSFIRRLLCTSKKSTTNTVGLTWFVYHDLLMLGWLHSAHPCEDYIRAPELNSHWMFHSVYSGKQIPTNLYVEF